MWPIQSPFLLLPLRSISLSCLTLYISHMIGPTHILNHSTAPHKQTFKLLLIQFPNCPHFNTIPSCAPQYRWVRLFLKFNSILLVRRVFLFLKARFCHSDPHFTSPADLAPFHFTCTSCTISIHQYILHHFTSHVHLAPFHFTCTSCTTSYQAYQTAATFHIFCLFVIHHDLNCWWLPSDSHYLSYSHIHWHSCTPSPFSQSTNHISLYPPHISDPHCPLNIHFTLQSVHQSHFAVPCTHLRPTLPP